MNTYQLRFKLKKNGHIYWEKIKANSIDEVSRRFRERTSYDFPEAIIVQIRKEKGNDGLL